MWLSCKIGVEAGCIQNKDFHKLPTNRSKTFGKHMVKTGTGQAIGEPSSKGKIAKHQGIEHIINQRNIIQTDQCNAPRKNNTSPSVCVSEGSLYTESLIRQDVEQPWPISRSMSGPAV